MSLTEFSKALAAHAEENRRKHQEFNKLLGVPDVFVEDSGVSGHGTGYWRVPGGVVAYRKYSSGYASHSRVQYPDDLLDLLSNLRERPVKQLPSPAKDEAVSFMEFLKQDLANYNGMLSFEAISRLETLLGVKMDEVGS